MNLSLTHHPALLNDPLNPGHKLKIDGNYVPAVPLNVARSLRVDGKLVGYVLRGAVDKRWRISLLYRYPEQIHEAFREFCKRELAEDVVAVNQPTILSTLPGDDDE